MLNKLTARSFLYGIWLLIWKGRGEFARGSTQYDGFIILYSSLTVLFL